MKQIGLMMVGLLLAGAPIQAADWQLSTQKATPKESVAKSVRDQLAESVVVIKDGQGQTRMRLWLVRELTSSADATQIQNGLTYRELEVGCLVGVIELAVDFIDYRKQAISKGLYTLRLARQPQTGDHMDTAPFADFLLLSPVKNDQKIASIEMQQLVKQSAEINDGDHPAVMLLFPGSTKPKDTPKMVNKAEEPLRVDFTMRVAAGLQSTTVVFSLVVDGHSSSRD